MTGDFKNILFLTNDKFLEEEIRGMLNANSRAQFKLDVLEPTKETINSIISSQYELVIVDVPDQDTYMDVVEKLCNSVTGIPMIALTNPEFQNSAEVIKLGAQFVLCKSIIDGKLLVQEVETAIGRKRLETGLRLRDEILQAVGYAAEVFLSKSNWIPSIEEVLARLGGASGSDRVYIYQNKLDDGNQMSTCLYANWEADGISNNPILPFVNERSYVQSGFIRWQENLSQNQIINGKMEDFPEAEKILLEQKGILSLVLVPIFFNEVWWGCIGFDQHVIQKNWSLIEIDALKIAARIFGAAIARQAAENELAFMATHDYLTSLPNRMLFEDRFNQAIAHAKRSHEKIAIISIDLDKFKTVNDTYGHPMGDEVLKVATLRFLSALRKSDTCARIGGDEFGVIAENIHGRADAMLVMEKLTKALLAPVIVDSFEIPISASMGAALYPDRGCELEELMKSADKALYKAKNSTSSICIFDDGQYELIKE